MAGRRGVEYDKSSRTKQPIIDALKAGDKKSFDFLGLPAEMRNMIYEELLVDDGLVNLGFDRLPVKSEKTLRSRKNFSILLACKQVYDEAKGIGAQALPLTVVFQVIARKGIVKDDIWFANKKRRYTYAPSFSCMLDGRSSLTLDQARTAEAMTIAIVVRREDDVATATHDWHLKLSSDLRSFVSLLMDNNVIKRLHVVVDFHDLGGDDKADVLVRPLFRLYDIDRVSVTARGVADATVEQLKASIRDTTPKHNMLQHCYVLNDDAYAFDSAAGEDMRLAAEKVIRLSHQLKVNNPHTSYYNHSQFWLDEGNEKAAAQFADLRVQMEEILVKTSIPKQLAKRDAVKALWRRENLPNYPWQVISAIESFIKARQATLVFYELPYFEAEAAADLVAAIAADEGERQHKARHCHASHQLAYPGYYNGP